MNHKPLQPLPPELIERACTSEDGSIAAGDRISDAEEFYLAGQRAGRAAAFAECREAATLKCVEAESSLRKIGATSCADTLRILGDEIRLMEPHDEDL